MAWRRCRARESPAHCADLRTNACERMIAGGRISIGGLGQQGAEYAYMGLVGVPNSGVHETEADRIGVEPAAGADRLS